jgi:hypothetical protein
MQMALITLQLCICGLHRAAPSAGRAVSPNEFFSIAVAIILFPLIIEVVHMTIFLRAVQSQQCQQWVHSRS